MKQEPDIIQTGRGVTLIDIIFLCITFGLIVIPTMPAYKYGGLILAIPVAIASLCAVIALWYCIYYILVFLFPEIPSKCETGKCEFYEGESLREQIGLEGISALFYFRCNCGHEYIQADNFLAKVNPDGSLLPYKRRGWFGWRKDKNPDVANYRVKPELLKQLRRLENSNKPDGSISKDATLNEILQKLNADP